MDILVGATERTAFPDLGAAEGRGVVEATVLAVRSSRGGRGPGSSAAQAAERRRRRSAVRSDPPGSRVLTLLIPDPAGIPSDAATGSYRVVLRFIRT